MSLISGLIHQSIDKIYSVSKDKYGDTTRTVVYKNIPCRWNSSSRRTIIVGSEKIQYNCVAYLLPDYAVQEDYLVEKDSSIYTIIKIDPKYDICGKLDHYKVYMK